MLNDPNISDDNIDLSFDVDGVLQILPKHKPVQVAYFDGVITVGCHKMSVAAYRIIRRRIDTLLDRAAQKDVMAR